MVQACTSFPHVLSLNLRGDEGIAPYSEETNRCFVYVYRYTQPASNIEAGCDFIFIPVPGP